MEEVVDRSSLASWYVIHTYSTYEVAVRDNILKMVENIGLQDYIFDVVVVFEEEITESKGKRKVVLKKKYPTYAFIKMIYTDHVYYNVTRIRGVTGFVGPGSEPTPLTDAEIEMFSVEVSAEEFKLKIGDKVEVVSGIFVGYSGTLQEISEDKKQLVILASTERRDIPIMVETKDVRIAE